MTDSQQLRAPFCGDDIDPTALSVEEARQRILETVAPSPIQETERLALPQALDRVLAEDIVAAVNVPPHNNSAMDGYALRASDIPADGGRELRIAGQSHAGHPFLGVCGAGECVRIMTGAVIPSGLDTVIPQEQVELIDSRTIHVNNRACLGDNIRAAGEDIRQGQTALNRGRLLTPADLGLIASLGLADVAVTKRLRVAFFSTGDELRAVGDILKPGEIHDSNRYTLFGMLSRLHCQITDLGIVRDDLDELRTVLGSAAGEYDAIVASGGVSVGDADYVRRALSDLGSLEFWKVAMKPGRPITFGRLKQSWFFGLPGNPVAVMVGFSQFVQPGLRRLSGEIVSPPLMLRAVCTSTLKKRPGRTEFQRGILSQDENGNPRVRKTGEQGSGILLSMSRANCFIVLNAELTRVEPGAEVWVQPFAGVL